MVLLLDEVRIGKVLRYETLIPAMERALARFSTGRVIQPVRNMIVIEEGKRHLGIMPVVAARRVRDVRLRQIDQKQPAIGIYGNVTLAADDLLGRVEAPRLGRRGLDGLLRQNPATKAMV